MKNIFNNIISDDEFFVEGPETEDYKYLVQKYFGLTKSRLRLNELKSEFIDRRLAINLQVNDSQNLEYTIPNFSGYSQEITELCNYVLGIVEPNEVKRFYALSGEKFDFCGAFIEPRKIIELSDEKLIFLSPDEYGEIRYNFEKEQVTEKDENKLSSKKKHSKNSFFWDWIKNLLGR